MTKKGYTQKQINELFHILNPLYKEASMLSLGQIVVCGIPYDKLNKMAYHSKAGGEPTNMPIDEIIQDCSKAITQGFQFRVMFAQEAMDPRSGVQLVNIMNDKETEFFCNNFEINFELEKEEYLNDILIYKNTDVEDKGRMAINQLYKKIDQTIAKIL
jgi:alkyl hydroperoxide reductase subunit AhpF